jgi:hypothetical protein
MQCRSSLTMNATLLLHRRMPTQPPAPLDLVPLHPMSQTWCFCCTRLSQIWNPCCTPCHKSGAPLCMSVLRGHDAVRLPAGATGAGFAYSKLNNPRAAAIAGGCAAAYVVAGRLLVSGNPKGGYDLGTGGSAALTHSSSAGVWRMHGACRSLCQTLLSPAQHITSALNALGRGYRRRQSCSSPACCSVGAVVGPNI